MKLYKLTPRKNAAQAIVEFAIVLPILLLLLYGLLEAGRLLFMYSTVVTASRQAARYGSATGQGGDYTTEGGPDNNTLQRFADCYGIKRAAQRVDFLNAFEDDDIFITYDEGPGTSGTDPLDPLVSPPTGWKEICDGTGDSILDKKISGNSSRIVVTIGGDFLPIVPRIVPFIARTRAGSNPITAVSARTIITGIAIEVTPPPGSSGSSGTGELSLSVAANPTSFTGTNEPIDYTLTITNSGSTDVTGPFTTTGTPFAVDWTAAPLTLSPGASTDSQVVTYLTTQPDVDLGYFEFTAIATGNGPDGTPVTADFTSRITYSAPVPNPAISLTKTVSPDLVTADDQITYTFTVSNSGNVDLIGASVSDPKLGGTIAGCSGDLVVGANLTCTATYTVTSADVASGSVYNTATASATYGTTSVSATDSATADIYEGSLFLTVSVSPTSVSVPGTVTYTYRLKNNRASTLYSPYTISNGLSGISVTCPSGSIAPGARITCTGTYSVTQTVLDAGNDLINSSITATACTDDDNCNGPRQVTSNSTAVTVAVVTTPSLSIQLKSVSPNPATTLNQVITYIYTVTNTGNVTLTPSIRGTKVDTVTCPTLALGETKDCTATYTLIQADLDAGLITSQATASVIFNGQTVSATAPPLTVVTFQGPRLNLKITPNPTTYPETGQFIVYTYTLTNTGTVPLNGPFSVSDDRVTSVDCSTATSPLESGERTSCIGMAMASGAPGSKIVNTATSRASDGTQTIISNSATATVSNPVFACNTITSSLAVPGNTTMTLAINNPNSYSVTIESIAVTWNHDNGHQGGNQNSLTLQDVSLGTTTLWSGSNTGPSATLTVPANTVIASGASTITFTFHQVYNRTDGSEAIRINLSTAGCGSSPIQQPPPPAP